MTFVELQRYVPEDFCTTLEQYWPDLFHKLSCDAKKIDWTLIPPGIPAPDETVMKPLFSKVDRPEYGKQTARAGKTLSDMTTYAEVNRRLDKKKVDTSIDVGVVRLVNSLSGDSENDQRGEKLRPTSSKKCRSKVNLITPNMTVFN